MNQSKTLAAWRQMADRGAVAQRGPPRAQVRASWRRCLASALDPKRFALLADDGLEARRAALADVLACALPTMRRLHDQICGTSSIVLLTDADGVVLDAIGDEDFIEQTPIATPGASWHELHLGTNGVGTCLAEGSPLQIVGAEHFFEALQVYTCSAAPIARPDGRVVACLDISSPRDLAHPHTLGMVSVAAEAIEQQLALRSALEQERAVFQLIQAGLVVFDGRGALRSLNRRAEAQLGLTEREHVGRPLEALFERGLTFEELVAGHEEPVVDQPIAVRTAQRSFEGHMSTACLEGAEGRVASVVVMLRDRARVQRVVARESGLRAVLTFEQIIGESLPLRQCVELARVAGASASNVLLRGESGTGKELFAQAIHNASGRAGGPFVAVNCGALPRELVQSELFGYRAGAFTGAHHKGHTGKFELAAGGTIFLDEIGDMPVDAQVSLLRFLESRELTRVGDEVPRRVDVRVIAATHTDLEQAIAEGRFREDLYYRLDVLSLRIPPLRERPGDVELLAEHFCRKYGQILDKGRVRLSRAALEVLRTAPWPGNVRQLENAIERAVNVVRGARVDVRDLPEEVRAPRAPRAARSAQGAPAQGSLRSETRRHLEAALQRHRGNVRRVAQELEVARSTVYELARRSGVRIDDYR